LSGSSHGEGALGFYGRRTPLETPGPGSYDPFPVLNPPAQRTSRPRHLPDRSPGFINVAGRGPVKWRPEPFSLSRGTMEQPLVHYASASFHDWQHGQRRSSSAPRLSETPTDVTFRGLRAATYDTGDATRIIPGPSRRGSPDGDEPVLSDDVPFVKRILAIYRRPQGGYILRRCGNAEDKKAGPDAIAITPIRRRLVVGREGCDVILKRMHVSKAHATLELHSRADGASWTLTIQDTSANGTWVNSAQLVPNQPLELRVGDRISFLPADHEFYPDALMYEVALLRPGDKVGASTGLLSSTQGTQQGNFAQSRPLTSLMSRSESDPTLRARPGRPVSSDIFIERP